MTTSARRSLSFPFGRRKRSDSHEQGTAGAVSTALAQAAAEHFSGELRVTVSEPGGTAHLYLLDGALYSLLLDGYPADPIARLLAGGHLDPSAAAVIGRGEEAESLGVERGDFSVDAVAAVHAELLLAAAGAVIAGPAATVESHPGLVTSRLCSVPVAIADVLAAVPLRAERLASTWALVSPGPGPDRVALAPVDPAAELPSLLPELRSLASALDGQRTVDAVAASLGFTRAEAVHLAASLVAAGVTQVIADAGRDQHGQGLLPAFLVPEAFGQTALMASEPAEVVEIAAAGGVVEARVDDEYASRLERELIEARQALSAASDRVASLERALEQARAGARPAESDGAS